MTPNQAIDEIMKLSEEQSRITERFTELEVEEIKCFNDFRGDFTSDKQCTMAFKRSPMGIEHLKTKARLNLISKQLTTLKTFLRHEENKARNLY